MTRAARAGDLGSRRVPTDGAECSPRCDALPGLARVAASRLRWHTTGWGVRRRRGPAAGWPARSPTRARRPRSPATPPGRPRCSASSPGRCPPACRCPGPAHRRRVARRAGRAARAAPTAPSTRPTAAAPQRPDLASLRERGAELLERSRDVWNDDDAHPAYDRILDELAPDEARILLLLLKGGPQPSVDVRTGGPIGMVSSHLIAPGLTMIGARAGCRYLDQVPSYLNNLFRLGLIWFSRESLRDPLEYQVVEAQPDVLAAMHSVRFAKVVRRSIHLTPFGEDFCRTCLVEEVAVREAPFPAHGTPPDADAGEPPGP